MSQKSNFDLGLQEQVNTYLNQEVLVNGKLKKRGDLTPEEVAIIEDEERFLEAVEQAQKNGTMTVSRIIDGDYFTDGIENPENGM